MHTSLLLPMELYVVRQHLCLAPHLLFFLGYLVFILPCSVCFNAQYENCQNSSACGNITIKYPFGVRNHGCGVPSFQVDCKQNSSPVIAIHGRNYTILKFSYDINHIVIVRDANCQFPEDHIDISSDYADTIFRITDKDNWTLNVFRCSNTLLQDTFDYQGGGEIRKCNTSVYYSLSSPLGHSAAECPQQQVLVEVGEMEWVSNDTIRDQSCKSCETSGGICGYNMLDSTATAPFVCYCKDGPYTSHCAEGHLNKSAIIILCCSIGGFALATMAVLLFIYYRKRRKQPPLPSRNPISKVEKFLKDYAFEMPTRYSQSDLKKMTNNFAEKLGEGGCGVVYKGKLRNGALVAVKLLDWHRNTEAQFMNEVATIGRVHHVNLVRLLGYCFQSFTSSLVYEFMVNGSLEKFIFGAKENGRILNWEQLYSIALGAARGIAYLHQDCEKRIIHFDIKPHNILLDADFTPKVCDFGLAKLCGKGDDPISMTGGRGTLGYVAPEVCDSDVGPVTDKSDVYSFGMLLLEIAGGRKNIDWKRSRSSQCYFPEWAFKLLESGELGIRLRGGELIETEDEEKARKLTKVGLWCIQYNYQDRPGMNRVVQMLEGSGDDVTDAPLPFDPWAAPRAPLFSGVEESSSSI